MIPNKTESSRYIPYLANHQPTQYKQSFGRCHVVDTDFGEASLTTKQ